MELDLIGQDLSSLREVNWDKAVQCESINFHFNRLTNLRGLPPLANIIELNLSSNHFKSCDLPELSALPHLVTLDLSGNKIASLRHLPHLPTLRNLSVAFNFITSVEYIQVAVPYLEQLDVRGNQIAKSADLDPLGELTHLRVLFIGGPQQNPVCSRIPNITRLFQICQPLQYIDDKNVSEWRNIQLLDAPTPKFDELLKQRNSSSGKKQRPSQQHLANHHSASASKVLFPHGEHLSLNVTNNSNNRRSPRVFEFDNFGEDTDDGYYHRLVPHEQQHPYHPHLSSHSHQQRHHRPSFTPDTGMHQSHYHPYAQPLGGRSFSHDSQDMDGYISYVSQSHHQRGIPHSAAARRPSTSSATSGVSGGINSAGAGIRTNPWSTASYSDSEAQVNPAVATQTETSLLVNTNPPTIVNNQPHSLMASPTFSSKGSSPRKPMNLTIQVEDEPPQDKEKKKTQQTGEKSDASSQLRTTFSSPSKTPTTGKDDSVFRKEEQQLSLRLVSTLMTLTALNEKQAIAQKLHVFHSLKIHAIEMKLMRQAKEKDAEIERLRLELLREEQEHHSAKANYEQRLLENTSHADSLLVQLREKDIFLQDAKRSLDHATAERATLETEKKSYIHELIDVRQAVEDANLRILQLQSRETQLHQESNKKDETIQRLQDQLRQNEAEMKIFQQELEYCRHHIKVQEEATANYKTSVQVLQDTIHAKDDAVVLKEHEVEVLKSKLAEFEQAQVKDEKEKEESLFLLRRDVVELTEKNKCLQRQIDELESRRLESRLMTLQTAFDEISQHNLELQKELIDKNVQHQNDRKVMKELSKCIKKLQEIDAYRKHLPCEQCQLLKQTIEERDGQLDRLRHDFVQVQHDYQELRLHDNKQQQMINMEAQKQVMLEQLNKLEATMREIDLSKHDAEMQLQVKDVMLQDQRLQIEALHQRIHDCETLEHEWQDEREDYEAKLQLCRQEIQALEETLETKTQIAYKVKRIIRDYLSQELKRQQQARRKRHSGDNNNSDSDEDDNDEENATSKGRKQRWNEQELSKSIERLDLSALSSQQGKYYDSRKVQHKVKEDDEEEDTELSEKERERQWAMKRLRNAVQHAQGFPSTNNYNSSSSFSSSGEEKQATMDDNEFLSLLEDIDGIALSKFHHESSSSPSRTVVGKPPRPVSNRYKNTINDNDDDDDEQEVDPEEYDNEDGDDNNDKRQKNKKRNKAESNKNTKMSSVCHNIQCQQQREALQHSLEDAYQQLSQQKIDFELQLAKKNEEYQRVSESLTRLEEKSRDLASIINSEKERYEVSVEKFRLDKKKLSKACRVLEEELKKKNEELAETKAAAEELQHAFAAFQKLQNKSVTSTSANK